MKRGYYVALAGLAIFVITIFAGVLANLEDDAAGLAILGSFAMMGLCFWIATAIVSVEKGYSVLVGIALGMIGLVGLLVVTLLPDRSKAS